MTNEEMRAAILAQIRAWEAGDADGLANGFVSDGEIVVAGKVIAGREALRATVTRFASRHSDVAVSLGRIIYGDNCAAVEYRWADTKNETGQRYVADDAVWVDFRDGLICRWREYWDNETPRAQQAATGAG